MLLPRACCTHARVPSTHALPARALTRPYTPTRPHLDVCTAIDLEDLILAVDAVRPLPEAALPALKRAGLVDAGAPAVELTLDGADETALRVARVLTHPEAAAADAGRSALAKAAEAEALQTLAAVARARHASLPDGSAAYPVGAFFDEKRRVLEASADALKAQAASM